MSWKQYDKAAWQQHGGRHLDGSSKPDHQRGNGLGEIKHRQTTVRKPEVITLRKKWISEIQPLTGVTQQLSITWQSITRAVTTSLRREEVKT